MISDKALTEISAKVNSVLNQLPTGSQQPTPVGQGRPDHRRPCISAFNSDVLASNQITDYLVRVVQPKLQAVDGVQTAETAGLAEFRAQSLARSGQARGLQA